MALFLIALSQLSACRNSDRHSSLTTKTVTLTQAQLQSRIGRRFPVTVTKSAVSVTFENPKVILADGSDRIGIDLDVRLKVPLGPVVSGAAAITGDLRYEPSARAFFFRDPEIEKLEIQGLKAEHDQVARKAAQAVAAATLNAIPIYELDHSMTEFAASVMLREVRVKDGVLHISAGLP
jgi:hypothetical protein